MKYSAVIASAASIASFVSAAPQKYDPVPEHLAHLFPRQKPSLACSHLTGGVHVIAVPGEGFANPPYGLIGSLATSILNAIPGSTNVSVPYNHSQTNGVLQATEGTNNLNSYIFQYHHYCPNTKIVLLGYSGGAIDVMNSLCGESNPPYTAPTAALDFPTYNPYVIAAIAYGDETRIGGTSYDIGNCTTNGPHPRANPAGCNPWASRIRSFCDDTDPECCPATGTDINDHYVYPQEYDVRATKFVVAKFKKSGGA